MAPKKSSQAFAPPALRSQNELIESSTALLIGHAKTEEQAEILLKADTDFLRQRVIVAKELLAQQVLTRGEEAAAHHYIKFVNTTQALRSQMQGTAVEQKVDQFLTRLEEDHGNSLLATHYITEQRIQEIVAAPVDPPAWQEEEYEVELPNLFQQIFGGHVTSRRVRR